MEEYLPRLLSYLKGIWKCRWYAVTISWLVFLIGSIVVYSLPDKFQATARVFVDTQGILKPLLSNMTTTPNIEQQVSIMGRTLISRPNIERVLRMVDLDINATTVKDHEQLVKGLMEKIILNGTGRDNLYTVSYTHKDPKIAKDVVQSILTIFVEGSFGDKSLDSSNAVKFITEQIKIYEEKLVIAENALKNFKIKNSGLLPRDGADYGSKLINTMDSLTQAKLDLLEAEQARNAIKKQITGDGIATKTTTTFNPEIDGRIQELNKNLDILRLKYTEEHPDVVSTKRLITQLEARKIEEDRLKIRSADPGKNFSPMLQQLTVALSAAEAKVAAMQARVDEYTIRSVRLKELSFAAPKVEEEYSQLNRDYLVNKDSYEKLLGRREAAKLSGDLSATSDLLSFRVIDPPVVPLLPSGPNRLIFYTLVFILAILAGLAGAFMISQIQPIFYSQNSLREFTGLPILGTVTMNWTIPEQRKRKQKKYFFVFNYILMFGLFGGLIVKTALKMFF
jgi:polysaccharide chain length determinant protein (PEP-CTERM system associated)